MTSLLPAGLSAIALALGAAAASHAADPATAGPSAEESHWQTVAFDIQNMTCATCPIAVKTAMERVDGVSQVEIDYPARVATATFDPRQTTAQAIAQASGEAGYPATPRQD